MAQNARRHITALLFLAAVLVVYFFPAIRAGALSAHDVNYLHPPFEFLEAGQEGNGLLVDQAEGGDPTRAYVINSLREGRFPFWTPYTGLGEPLTGSGASSVLFPLNFFFYFLPYGVATILVGFSKLFIAGVGMYLLIQVLIQNRLVSAFAASAFMLGGFNIVWLGHPHTNVSIWLPWLLLFTWQFFKTKRRIYLIPYAFVVGIQFFGGHIETSLHILSLTGLLALILTAISKDWISFLYFAVSSVLGFFLAAPQLFPFIEYLLNSLALVGRSAQKWKPYLLFPSLIPSVLPNFFGNPSWHVYWYQPQKHFNYNETVMGFPGTLSLLLTPLFLFSKRWRRWGVGITLLILATLLGMLGVPPFFTFLSKVPPFSWTLNGRLLLLTSFLLIILAAISLGWLADLRMPDLQRFRRRGRDWMKEHNQMLFSGIAALLILSIAVSLFLSPEIRDFSSGVAKKFVLIFHKGPKQAFLEFGFVFAAFIVLIALKLKNLISSKLFLTLITVVALFDGFLYSWNYNPPFRGEFFTTVPEIEYVQENAGYSRVLFNRRALRPNLARAYNINDPRSRSALVLYPAYQFLRLAGIENRLRMLSATAENKRFLDFLDVRYIAFLKEEQADLPGLEKVFEGNSMTIYKNNDAFARAFTAKRIIKVDSADKAIELLGSEDFDLKSTVTVEGLDGVEVGSLSKGPVSIQSFEPERVTLEVSCPEKCFVVLTDTNYPGWVADLDGKRTTIYKTDVAFRGVYIPEAGSHRLVFSFVPFSFLAGVVASALALTALLGLAFVSIKA